MCMQILHMPYLDRFIYFPIYRAFNQDHITRPVCDLNQAIINKKRSFSSKTSYIFTLQIRFFKNLLLIFKEVYEVAY